MNSLKMLVLILFQWNTQWFLFDLLCEGDFATTLPPIGYFVSEYCEFNGKCFLCKVGDGKTTSMFEEQKRDRVLTGMSDVYKYMWVIFHTIHLITMDKLNLSSLSKNTKA